MSSHSFHLIHSNECMPSCLPSFLQSFTSVRSPQSIHFNLFTSIHSFSFARFMHVISFQLASFQLTNNSYKQNGSYSHVLCSKFLPRRVPGIIWYEDAHGGLINLWWCYWDSTSKNGGRMGTYGEGFNQPTERREPIPKNNLADTISSFFPWD